VALYRSGRQHFLSERSVRSIVLSPCWSTDKKRGKKRVDLHLRSKHFPKQLPKHRYITHCCTKRIKNLCVVQQLGRRSVIYSRFLFF